MSDDTTRAIGKSLTGFQASLNKFGSSLDDYLAEHYVGKWTRDATLAALAIRTTFVGELHAFLIEEGLLNIDRVQLSLITDPLAHDIEHLPTIAYKGHRYVTTHSMIYLKFMACHHPDVKGVFVDSPNIRLEVESPTREQRGRYLIDFSQVDVELRRNSGLSLDDYYDRPERVRESLDADMERAFDLFERMLERAVSAVATRNATELKRLGVALETPTRPWPRFRLDEAIARYGLSKGEVQLGEETDACFFWITGLMRENYDLIYPYLARDGSRRSLDSFPSADIYNYDICARGIRLDNGKRTPAREILSGALREWLYEPIVERLLDNRILPAAPEIVDGNVMNLDALGGYGPFLLLAARGGFPDTFGGGVGLERSLWALLQGPEIERIEDVTLFGKNPDSHPIYLF